MPLLSSELRSMLGTAVHQYHKNVDQAGEYLVSRGISQEAASSYRLGVVPTDGDLEVNDHELYRGRLAIPYLTKGGVVNIKFRSMDDRKPKYLGLPGRNNLYNMQALFRAGNTIAVSEGELDALSLSMSGVPCVGIPGATNWQKHYKYIFDDFTRVIAFCDGDDPGKAWGESLREKVGAVPVHLPDGEDVNSMIVKGELEWLKEKM